MKLKRLEEPSTPCLLSLMFSICSDSHLSGIWKRNDNELRLHGSYMSYDFLLGLFPAVFEGLVKGCRKLIGGDACQAFARHAHGQV